MPKASTSPLLASYVLASILLCAVSSLVYGFCFLLAHRVGHVPHALHCFCVSGVARILYPTRWRKCCTRDAGANKSNDETVAAGGLRTETALSEPTSPYGERV